MLSSTEKHSAVSLSNKMFIIGGKGLFGVHDNFEVFDNVTRKFTSVKNIPTWIEYLDQNQTVCVGYKVYLFLREENNKVKIHSYDIKRNLFSVKTSLSLG